MGIGYIGIILIIISVSMITIPVYAQMGEMDFYENKLYEFSFDIPTNWVYIENVEISEIVPKYLVALIPIDISISAINFTQIGVQYEYVPSSLVPTLNERTVENYISEQIMLVLESGKITSSSVESRTWGWVVSTEYFFSTSLENGEILTYFLDEKSYFFKNRDLYLVEYVSSERNFDRYHPDIENVIETLEIKGIDVSKHELIPVSLPSSNGGGCLIATATYGSELAPQVQQLRELRDNSLLQTQSGSAFMSGFNHFYYSFSPTIADWERQNPAFKEAVKLTITPMLSSLSILNYVDMDSEAEVLGYGISLILLNIGMYFVAPAILIIKLKRFK